MYIDIFSDFGLTNNTRNKTQTENIIIEYTVDETSLPIVKGNIVTFVDNKVKKLGMGEVPHAIALSDGEPNQSIKCALFGIAKIEGLFVAGEVYYNTENGELTTTKPTEVNKFTNEIGKALNSNELLLKDVFINV